jgi:hypothetical protein
MKHKETLFIAIFLLIPRIFPGSVFSQDKNESFDSVFVPLGNMVVIGDSILRFRGDTTICIEKNSGYKVKKDKEYKSEDFYNNFKDKSDKNILLKGIYDASIREKKDTSAIIENFIDENYHPEFTGKIVGKIEIRYVDIIDGDVNDTSIRARSSFSKTLNGIHKDTYNAVVRKNLTIKEGDILGAYTISDNEKYLRSLKYIEDSKIYITSDSLNSDTLNLLVVVKDIFPFTVAFGMGGVTDYTLGVSNVNILGSGHEFSNAFRYDASKNPAFGYVGELIFQNLWGSFVDANLYYKNNAIEETSRLTVKRDFITPETKYGGGMEYSRQKTFLTVEVNDSEVVDIPYTKNYFDQWIGRSFLYNEIERKSVVIKARYMSTLYSSRPNIESDTNQQFYNVNLLIGSVTLLKKNHYKEKMLLGYGMVEDIDYGYAVELTYGYQLSEYLNAPYFGLSLKAAKKYHFGYLGGGVEYGAHSYNNMVTYGLFRTACSYYSNLFKMNQIHYRFLTRWNYTEGIRRYSYDYINLGKEVRGASNSGLEGNKRLVARFELVTFLKGNWIGFRFSPNLFYDAAFLNTGTKLFSSQSFYSGIGAGVRIRNENLAFQTIIIRLEYFTDNPLKNAHFGVGFTSSVPDVFKDYDIAEPDILHY